MGLAALGGIVWLGDWLVLRHKMASSSAFGQIEVQRRYQVSLKNRRIEQRTEKLHSEECVQSLFPHYGDDPCWYLADHARDVEDINGAQWHFYNP